MAKKYINRLFDDVLDFSLKSKGAVIIVGPKWCGKSTTASRYAKTLIDLMPLDTRNDYISLSKVSPSEFLNLGEKPILIEDWQYVSFIWNQIILTGSVSDIDIKNLLKEFFNRFYLFKICFS